MLQINLNAPVLYLWSGNYIKSNSQAWITRTQKSSYQIKVIIVLRGPIFITVNETKYILMAGDCITLPPHAKLSGFKKTNSKVNFFWLQFMAKSKMVSDQNDPIIMELRNNNLIQDVNSRAILPAYFKITNLAKISFLFRQLLSLVNTHQYTERGRDFFTAYFITELSNDYLNQLSALTQKPSKIQNIMEWINVNISQDLTVQKVADHFNFNPSYLSRLFKNNLDVGVKQYIMSSKLNSAKNLLLSSSLQINEIALKTGFSDSKLFDHSFKKYNGVLPTLFRQFFSATHLTSPKNDPKPSLPAEYGTAAIQKLIRQIIEE